MSLTRETALQAVSALMDPISGKTLGEAKMVKDLVVEEGTARVTIELASPSSGAKGQIDPAVHNALTALGAQTVEVVFTSVVRTRQVAGDDPCPEVKNVILVMSGKGGVGK